MLIYHNTKREKRDYMIKIVVDSGCDFTPEMKNKQGINIEAVPLSLQLEETQYVDDDSLDITNYINEMEKCKTHPKTAAPSPDLYLEKFKGPESIFAVTLSSHLSASYANAMLAKEMFLNEIGTKFIHVFDSLGASVGETLIALKVNELYKKNFSDHDIVTQVNEFIKNSKIYFILDTYQNLTKNGRMNPYIAKLATVLSIKPICTAIEGKIALAGQARGLKNAFKKLVDIMLKEGSGFENKILAITHVKSVENALAFKDEVMKRIKFKEILITEASGLCSTYAERNGIIISY